MVVDERAKHFVELLLPAFGQAAAIAAALQGRVANQPKASEASEVKAALTLADTAVQEAILVPLLKSFGRCALEAEEDTRSVASFSGDAAEERIIVDPIDGTFHFYLGGRGAYATMAGWALDARYRAALVAIPTAGWLYTAVDGQGAYATRVPTTGEPAAAPVKVGARERVRRVLVSDTTPPAVHEALRERGLDPRLASGGAISIAPLLPGVAGGLRISNRLSPTGISARGRVGVLVAREAGAWVGTASDEVFPQTIDEPVETLVVARNAAIAGLLQEAMAER